MSNSSSIVLRGFHSFLPSDDAGENGEGVSFFPPPKLCTKNSIRPFKLSNCTSFSSSSLSSSFKKKTKKRKKIFPFHSPFQKHTPPPFLLFHFLSTIIESEADQKQLFPFHGNDSAFSRIREIHVDYSILSLSLSPSSLPARTHALNFRNVTSCLSQSNFCRFARLFFKRPPPPTPCSSGKRRYRLGRVTTTSASSLSFVQLRRSSETRSPASESREENKLLPDRQRCQREPSKLLKPSLCFEKVRSLGEIEVYLSRSRV